MAQNQLKLDKMKAVENVKKEADRLMINKILNHKKQSVIANDIIRNKTKEIKQLKKEAQDSLLYP